MVRDCKTQPVHVYDEKKRKEKTRKTEERIRLRTCQIDKHRVCKLKLGMPYHTTLPNKLNA
jgi:hypothetical protein